MEKICIVCGKAFQAKSHQKCCSKECSVENNRVRNRNHERNMREKRKNTTNQLHKSTNDKIKRECEECLRRLEELERRAKKLRTCPYECRMAHPSVRECGKMSPVHESSGVTYIKVPDLRCTYEHK